MMQRNEELEAAYRASATPLLSSPNGMTTTASGASFWPASALTSAYAPYTPFAAAELRPTPFSSAHMDGASLFRSALLDSADSPASSLSHAAFPMRALVTEPTHTNNHGWMHSADASYYMQHSSTPAWDAWGVPSKQPDHALAEPAPHEAQSVHSLKELSMPRLDQLMISSAVSTSPVVRLPLLPLYLEATCFSLPQASLTPVSLWTLLKHELLSCGVIVGEEAHSAFELTCSATGGVNCCEFRVFVYDGHFSRSNNSGVASYTIELQRQTGCSMAFGALFQHVLCMLHARQVVGVECKLGGASVVAAPVAAASASCGPELAMPSLSPRSSASLSNLSTTSAATPSPINTPTLYAAPELISSLLDLITSREPGAQLDGIHALSLCDLAAQPSQQLHVWHTLASLLQQADVCPRVRLAASTVCAQASTQLSCARAMLVACLPVILAQLAAPIVSTSQPALAQSCAAATRKQMLRSCANLSAADSDAFQRTLLSGGVMASARIKRAFLLEQDEETRALVMSIRV